MLNNTTQLYIVYSGIFTAETYHIGVASKIEYLKFISSTRFYGNNVWTNYI